jgi:hypothetical protein
MVYIDPVKSAREGKKRFNRLMRERKKFFEFCENNEHLLEKNKLSPTVSPEGYAGIQYVLYGRKSLEECVFDGNSLKRISAFFGGSNMPDHAIYSCSKCRLKYDLPLNKEDIEIKKRIDRIPYVTSYG